MKKLKYKVLVLLYIIFILNIIMYTIGEIVSLALSALPATTGTNQANQTNSVERKEPQKNVCIIVDVSGSTQTKFVGNMTVLEKETEIAEQYILANPENKYTLVVFSDKATTRDIVVLKEEQLTNIHDIIPPSNGGTLTDKALVEVNRFQVKPSVVILLTDGETSSTQENLRREIELFERKNIRLEVIAVSPTDIDMQLLSASEERKIPGMDLINYLGNSVSRLEIFNRKHMTSPYIGASGSGVDKNFLTFMEIPFKGFVPEFIRSVVSLVVRHNGEIDWKANNIDFKRFLSEIGKLFAALFVTFPESNTFIEEIVRNLSEKCGVDGMTEERIRKIISYGFDCMRQKKPILYTNFEAHVKEGAVKKAEFADAIGQLKTCGTTLGANISISMPTNGLVIVNHMKTIPLTERLNCYPNSADKYRNYYFGCDGNPQAIRIALREFAGTVLGVKNPIGSYSVIFYVASQMSLMAITGHLLDSPHMKMLRELAVAQTSLETLVEKGKYSGVGCFVQWKNGLLPKIHFTESVSHTSLYTDPLVNPLRLNEPLWWALMMSMLGIFEEQLPTYSDSLKSISIEPTEKAFLKWVSDTFSPVVNGKIELVNVQPQPTSVFSLSEFDQTDEIFMLKDHGNCRAKTCYSREEMMSYVMQPDKGCVWCRYHPTESDFERVTFSDPDTLIQKARQTARALTINTDLLKVVGALIDA